LDPLLTVEEVRAWIREYDNGDEEDIRTNERISMLISTAEGYVKNACGTWYKDTPELINATKFIMLTLINDWWENRSFMHETPRMTMQQRQSLQGLLLQIQMANPEVILDEI